MKLSFSQRIFGAMFLLILLTSLSVFFITIYHFRDQSKKYHEDRLKRKEDRIIESINYELDKHPTPVSKDNLKPILSNKIFGIAHLNDQKINLFTLDGKLLLSTAGDSDIFAPQHVFEQLNTKKDRIDITLEKNTDNTQISSFSYVYNINHHPVGVVNVPYYSNNHFFNEEKNQLLQRFGLLMPLVLILGGVFAWLMSKQITKRLKTIANKLKSTQMVNKNQPLVYNDADEVKVIVDSYNEMLNKLETQSQLLAKKEREEAWREMAKQVAHEVKNPLTPMKLTVQSFKQRFNPKLEDAQQKVTHLCDVLLNQIDSISSIAEAFSDFAKLPIRQDHKINLVHEIKTDIDIFNHHAINFESSHQVIEFVFDKIYLTRIINNLVKNALQSVPNNKKPKIDVQLNKTETHIELTVKDNGVGINESEKEKIFEPKFTTKTSGMGMGLPMVKKIVEDYNGWIDFESKENQGTTFTLRFPFF